MNAITRHVFDGEVLGPGDGLITLITYPHPLRADRCFGLIAAGQTIADIAAGATNGGPFLAALFGDTSPEIIIPSDRWHRVRPKPGTTLVLKAVVEGREGIRTAAMIGIAVAAIAAVIFIPGAIAALPAFAEGATILGLTGAQAGALAAGAASLAISVGGMLLVNTLIPIRPPRIAPAADVGLLATGTTEAQGSRTIYSIAGAQNQARPFGSVPVVLGRHRLYPPYATLPYTELVGDDMYLRLVFCIGYGPLQIEELKIGETPLSAFIGVEHEIRAGYASDSPLTLYPQDVFEQALAIQLKAGVQHELLTQPNTDYASVDITVPNGVFQINTATGNREPFPVILVVQYQNVLGGASTIVGNIEFSLENQTARRGITMYFASRGQYRVFVTRGSNDGNATNIADQAVWSALRSFKFETPITFDAPLALVSMRIKASGQLNGVVSDFNCVASSLVESWNGSAWVPNTVSKNPADLIRHALQSPANKRHVLSAGIDLQTLQDFWIYCWQRGFTYSAVIEQPQSVYSTIADIAAAGRGVPVFLDGRWGVAWDRLDSPIVQHFTPRNSSGFTGSRRYRRLPHAFRCKFVNEDAGYAADERIVYADDYNEANATMFEAIEFPGVTDSALIWKHGRYRIAEAILRPEIYTLAVDFEHLRCNRLDRVRVSHDVPLIGQTAGRVKVVDEFANPVITLDERVAMLAGHSYSVRFRLANGETLWREVVTAEGESNSFELIAGPGGLPEVGDLAMFGEYDVESAVFRIRSIEPQADLRARLTLVDDAPEIDQSDSAGIPAFDSHITPPIDLTTFPPTDLHCAEIIDGAGAAKSVRARFSWRALRISQVISFEVQARDDTAPPLPDPTAPSGATIPWGAIQTVPAPQQFCDFPDTLLGTWSFRVRSLFDRGGYSSWAVLEAKNITGVLLSSPLPDVTFIHEVYRARVTNIDWTEVVDFREPIYEIRKGPTWISAITVGTVAHPPFPTLGNDIYWIAAFAQPIAGLSVYSANPQSITIGGAQLVENVVALIDEAASGWTGTFFGSAGISGAIMRTGGAGNVLTEADFLAIADLLNFGGGSSGVYEIPASEVFDFMRVCECAISITIEGGGAVIGQNVLSMADFLAEPDLLQTGASRLVDIYAQIAVAIDDPPTTFGPWERWSSGVKQARAVKARVIMNVLDPLVYAFVTQFKISIDVPDRLDHYSYTTSTSGDTVVFTPDLAVDPAPFNGGPNGSPYPQLAHGLVNGDATDHVELSSLTASSVFVRVFQGAGAGTGVSRVINLLAQGF